VDPAVHFGFEPEDTNSSITRRFGVVVCQGTVRFSKIGVFWKIVWKDGYAGRCLEASTFDAWEVDQIHGETDDITRVAYRMGATASRRFYLLEEKGL